MTSFFAAGIDSLLTLYASDGATVIETDNENGTFGTLSSSIAGAVIPSTGTYYIRVNENTGTSYVRPYELWLNVQSGTSSPEVEANDTQGTDNPLPANGWVSGARSLERQPNRIGLV